MFVRSVIPYWFATPWTPPLWQRGFFGKLSDVATLFAFGEKRCRKNLPLCDRRLIENPYDSPTHSTPSDSGRRSLRSHAIASVFVISLWFILIAALLWSRIVSVADGNVSIEYTPQPDATDPFGLDVSTHLFDVNTIGALTLMAVAVALSLAVVNGIIAYWRRTAVA